MESNPFGNYSNVSVDSDEFKSVEDSAQRLDRDERNFSIGNSSLSLSGIYGDPNTSFNVDGERMTASGFLISGSEPLGCLEGGVDSERPQFGMVVKSPETTGTARPIMPLSNDSQSSNDSKKEKTMSSIVEGDSSFCRGVDRSGVDSASVSVCNITDFEGDDDACVCVMTPQSMDFIVFNELSHPAEYSLSKTCYVDGQRKDSAAHVHISVPELILYPGQRRTITVNVVALTGGVLKIKIEVTRKNILTQEREHSNLFGKIVAELPKVSLLTQHKEEMLPNPECQHVGKYLHTIVMKNEGHSTVPLKLTVTKVTHEDVLFHFGGREKQTVTVMVDPGQTVRQLVLCETPPIFAHLQHPDTTIPVEGTVEFLLATTDYQLNPVAPVTLVATLRPNFFGAPATLAVPSDLPLYNGSDQTVVFRTTATLGYTVQPSWFNIPPNQTLVVHVDIDDINPIRCGNLNLHTIFPKEERFKIELEKVTSLDSLEEGAPVAAEPTPSTSSGSGTPGPVPRVSLGDSKDSLEEGAPVAAEPTPSTSSGSGTPSPVPRVSLGDSKGFEQISIQNQNEIKSSLRSILGEISTLKDKVDMLISQKPQKKRKREEEKEDAMEKATFFNDLPVKDLDQLNKLEEDLKDENNLAQMIHLLARAGGSSTADACRRALRTVMADEVACLFSWAGQKGKRAFSSLRMKTAVFRAVQKQFADSKNKDIERAVQDWLKPSKNRLLSKEKSRKRRHDQEQQMANPEREDERGPQ